MKTTQEIHGMIEALSEEASIGGPACIQDIRDVVEILRAMNQRLAELESDEAKGQP